MNAVICGLLGLFMAGAHCPQHLPLRADRFGLIDAASSRNEMIGAIAIVNRILQGRADHKVMPSWDADGGEEDTSGRTFYVFLVRSPSDPAEVIKQQKALEAHLADFHRALENLPPMDPRFTQCTDFEACAKEMYRSYDLAATQIAVVSAINSLDTAEVRDTCGYCVLIQSAAFERFVALYGTNLDGTRFIRPEYLAVFLILHEIGHLENSFSIEKLRIKPPLSESYARLKKELSPPLWEELRADAYAATLIQRAWYDADNHRTNDAEINDVAETQLAQWLLTFKFTTFDKSDTGIQRRYLDASGVEASPPPTHPNWELRLLAIASLIATPAGVTTFTDQLNQFLDDRSRISSAAQRPAQ
jgi:hypothetical protein